ncbi:Ig-like domain-containing protein [Mycolicibacterium sp. XJ662]
MSDKQSMSGYARFVGRVGVLAVILGVGSVLTNPGIAIADTESASSADTSSTDAGASTESTTGTASGESTSTSEPSSEESSAASSITSAITSAIESFTRGVQASGGANTSVRTGDEATDIDSGTEEFADSTEAEVDDEESTEDTAVEEGDDPEPETGGPSGSDRSSEATAATDDTTQDSIATVSAATVRSVDPQTAVTVTVTDDEQTALQAPAMEFTTLTEAPKQSETQITASQPVSSASNLLAAPVRFVTGLVSTLLATNPLMANSPVAPPTSTSLWALLGWVRRQIEYTFFNHTPTTSYDATQNSQTFNGVILGNINAADADGDKLTYTVTKAPEHGSVVLDSSGGFSYVPTSEMAATGGTDTFTITVDDRPGNPLHFHGLATFFKPNGGATTRAVVSVTVDPVSPIGTEAQIRLEQLATQIANSPEVQAMRETMRQHWLTVAEQKYAAIGGVDEESLNRLEEALDEFILGVAMRVVNTDAARPEVLTIALPEHEWYGISTASGRWFYDNPDSVYRVIPVASGSSYVITGRYVGERPLDGNLSVYTDNSVYAPASNLAFEDIEMAADGTFTITVDSTPANGRVNHIQLADGANQIVVRETLGDWTATAAFLEVTRVGGPAPGPAKTYDELVDDAVALLVNDAVNLYRPETDPAIYQPANVLLPPITLPGTLIGQRQSWGHFVLGENEALVVTITPGDAGYFTIPVTDVWMKSPNYWDHQSSLNSEQAIANADGTYTIVVSKTDPGVANWVDTVGLDMGTLLVRWQVPGANPDGGDPTVSAQVVSLDDLDTVVPAETVWVTPEQRQQQLDARKAAFSQRFSPFVQA